MAKKTFRMPSSAPKVEAPKPDWKTGSEGSEVSFSMSGLQQLQEVLNRIPDFYKDVAGSEIADIAGEIIEDAKENYVPFLLGNLRSSGRSDDYDAKAGTDTIEIACWFAGEDSVGMPAEGGGVGSMMSEKAIKLANKLEMSGKSVDPRDYALEQHENLSFHHEIGGPKYLEIPFMAMLPKIIPRVVSAVDAAMANVGGFSYQSDWVAFIG